MILFITFQYIEYMNYTKKRNYEICNSVSIIFIGRNIMNIVFIQGKVISDVEFNFIINSTNISIAIFQVELLNKSKITVKAYNELADYCYRKLKRSDIIFLEGYLNSKMEIIIKSLTIFLQIKN